MRIRDTSPLSCSLWSPSLLFTHQTFRSRETSSAGSPLGPGQPLLDLKETKKAWSQGTSQAPKELTCSSPPPTLRNKVFYPGTSVGHYATLGQKERMRNVAPSCVCTHVIILPEPSQLRQSSMLFNSIWVLILQRRLLCLQHLYARPTLLVSWYLLVLVDFCSIQGWLKEELTLGAEPVSMECLFLLI